MFGPRGTQQEGREEDQRLINLVGESLRLLGNTFVALSDLRCNLACAPPRHLHVVRPMSHYTTPMVLQQAAIPIQVGHGEPEGEEGYWWDDPGQLSGLKEFRRGADLGNMGCRGMEEALGVERWVLQVRLWCFSHFCPISPCPPDQRGDHCDHDGEWDSAPPNSQRGGTSPWSWAGLIPCSLFYHRRVFN